MKAKQKFRVNGKRFGSDGVLNAPPREKRCKNSQPSSFPVVSEMAEQIFFDNPETDPSLRIKVKGLIQWDISDGRSESALSWSSPPGCHARYANVSGLGIEL